MHSGAHAHQELGHPWGPVEGADSENMVGSQGNGVLANGLWFEREVAPTVCVFGGFLPSC